MLCSQKLLQLFNRPHLTVHLHPLINHGLHPKSSAQTKQLMLNHDSTGLASRGSKDIIFRINTFVRTHQL